MVTTYEFKIGRVTFLFHKSELEGLGSKPVSWYGKPSSVLALDYKATLFH
jgi:hypothetical protein